MMCFNGTLLRKLLRVVLEFERDLRATRQVGSGSDLIAARAFTRPLQALLFGLKRTAKDCDFLRYHERGIKSHAELADQLQVRLLLLRNLLKKRLRARMRDGAEVLDHFPVRHADACVRNRDRAGLVVGGNGDGGRDVGLMNGLAGRLAETEFLARVGCVGNQLPHEDLLVRVERVNDDIQQLLYLRLKMMRFDLGHSAKDKDFSYTCHLR